MNNLDMTPCSGFTSAHSHQANGLPVHRMRRRRCCAAQQLCPQKEGPVPVGAVALVDRGRSDGALLGRGHGARRAGHIIVGHHRGPHRLQRAVRGVPPARHRHTTAAS